MSVEVLRRGAEERMTSACNVFAPPSEPVTDPVTGEVTYTPGTVYSGKCRVRPSTGASAITGEAGGAEVFAFDYVVSLPFAVDVVSEGHRVTITESPDTALAGLTMEVQRVDRGDDITARRLFCQRVA